MFSKICVNGDDAHPLWKWMKAQPKGRGMLGNAIKWNFTKVRGAGGGVQARTVPRPPGLAQMGQRERGAWLARGPLAGGPPRWPRALTPRPRTVPHRQERLRGEALRPHGGAPGHREGPALLPLAPQGCVPPPSPPPAPPGAFHPAPMTVGLKTSALVGPTREPACTCRRKVPRPGSAAARRPLSAPAAL